MPQHEPPLPVWLQSFNLGILVGCLVVWSLVAWQVRRGRPIVAYQPRQPVPWRAIDLIAVFLLFVLNGQIAVLLLKRFYGGSLTNQFDPVTMAAICAVEVATFAGSLVWLKARCGATL